MGKANRVHASEQHYLKAREVVPQQRVQVGETSGTWRDGTTAWASEVTVTAGKGESLRNTLSWR